MKITDKIFNSIFWTYLKIENKPAETNWSDRNKLKLFENDSFKRKELFSLERKIQTSDSLRWKLDLSWKSIFVGKKAQAIAIIEKFWKCWHKPLDFHKLNGDIWEIAKYHGNSRALRKKFWMMESTKTMLFYERRKINKYPETMNNRKFYNGLLCKKA